MAPAREDAPADLDGLAGRLRALRKAAGISQATAGDKIGASQVKVSRAERGEFLLPPADVRTLARLYRAAPDEVTRLTGWAKALQPGRLDSRLIFQRGNNHFQTRVKEMEEGSALVRSYQPGMVIGVLQTQAYVETVMGQRVNPHAADAVRVRLARARRLLTDPGRQWVLIQTEGALRWPVHSPQVMAAQVEHIAATSALPNVRLGIISQGTPVMFTAPHGFHVYDRQAVQVGTKTATALTSDARDLDEYQGLFERLTEAALFGDEARALFARIAGEYRALR